MSASSAVRHITSRTNPLVQAAVRLHRRSDRHAAGQWLAEGPNVVAGALSAGLVETLFVTDDSLVRQGVENVLVADDVMAKIVTTRTHQGIAAICRRPPAVDTIPTDAAVLCLVAAADPGNVGTAIRTAAHAGMGAVVLTAGSADPCGPRAARASAGAVTAIPVIEAIGLDDLFASVAADRIVALDVAGSRSVFEPLPAAPVLLFGSEADGLSEEVLARCGDVRRIPQLGGLGAVDSLNLGASVAVAAYAAVGTTGDPT